MLRSLCVASVAVLAACSRAAPGPAPSTVNVVVPPASSGARAPEVVLPLCGSDDDCVRKHAGTLCAPKPVTKELADAEDFLQRALAFDDLVMRLGDTSGASPIVAAMARARADKAKYGGIANGPPPPDPGGVYGPRSRALTVEQMRQLQEAANLQTGAAEAEYMLGSALFPLTHPPITSEAQKLRADIVGDPAEGRIEDVVADLQALLRDFDAAMAQLNEMNDLREDDGGLPPLRSGAGMLVHHAGSLLNGVKSTRARVAESLAPTALAQRTRELAAFSRARAFVTADSGVSEALGTCLGTP